MGTITFLGAAGTVTGSSYLLEHEGHRVLVDCGTFQGERELRRLNRAPFPVDVKSLDAVVLTHAHVDHSGNLPRLVAQGYKGPIHATPGTAALCGLLLPDSARLQEEEAAYARKTRYSRHENPVPLYTSADARRTLALFETFGYGRRRQILPGLYVTFTRAGHILGSAVAHFELASTRQVVVFSGDLGRYDAPILRDPEAVPFATTLLSESTYGNKDHPDDNPREKLAEVVNEAAGRGGMLVIPAFAVGRTQDLLYHLRALEDDRLIPELDVFVDSPMACDVTPLYLAHPEDHDEEMAALVREGRTPLKTRRTRFVNSVHESKALNLREGPGIILSASGMATGGRILHHLANRLPDPKSTVLFVGFQSPGTRGGRILAGEPEVKIHGHFVKMAAQVRRISGFSAHAGKEELERWMDGFKMAPRQVLLIHGELAALEAHRSALAARGWPAYVPKLNETVTLAPAP
ncbi:MAG: MBL fold metallo-hydrolase [Deltaproteobacteria bacterium]|nr:MBL fold metallo-hydrolase [Deltaproteobacteria bacterium]